MSARVAITVSALDSASLVDALRVLVFANVLWLRRGHKVAPIYSSGVVFRSEPQAGHGVELYQSIPEVLAQGWGDCDDLAGWRCAELVHAGERADVSLTRVGAGEWHAVVVRADGSIEDPAKVLQSQERRSW